MSSPDRKFMMAHYAIAFISMSVGMAVIWATPFPYGMFISIGIMFSTMFYLRRRMDRRLGLSNSGSFFSFGNPGSRSGFECMSCSYKHKQRACPKCGSKMRKLGS